jgi:hypothetical protein
MLLYIIVGFLWEKKNCLENGQIFIDFLWNLVGFYVFDIFRFGDFENFELKKKSSTSGYYNDQIPNHNLFKTCENLYL